MKKFKTKPMSQQLKGLMLAAGKEYFGWFMEQGTGKTWVAINDAANLWGDGRITDMLVFAPNGVHDNWHYEELTKHMPDWVNYKSLAWSTATTAKYREQVNNFLRRDGNQLRILLMTWDAFTSKRSIEVIKTFINTSSKLLVVLDESHWMKNVKTLRFEKMSLLVKPHADYRRIMTGTPILKEPMDVFSQMTFLDDWMFGTTSFYAFKAEYAELLPETHDLVKDIIKRTGKKPQLVAKNRSGEPMYKNLDKLSSIIDKHSYRVLKSECLDLPPKIYQRVYFSMTPAQEKLYRLMKEEYRMMLGDGSVTAVNALTSLIKLSQITSGYYNTKENVLRVPGDNPKLNLFTETLEDALSDGSSIIVWASFRQEIEDIAAACKKIGVSHVEYDGSVSQKDRIKNRADFQNGAARVFIGQQQAGGTGITLTKAEKVIYYSNRFSYGDRIQSEDRAHRIGQHKNVVYIDLLGKGTIDIVILNSLLAKKSLASVINGDDFRTAMS